jgi:hypothetical protein
MASDDDLPHVAGPRRPAGGSVTFQRKNHRLNALARATIESAINNIGGSRGRLHEECFSHHLHAKTLITSEERDPTRLSDGDVIYTVVAGGRAVTRGNGELRARIWVQD